MIKLIVDKLVKPVAIFIEKKSLRIGWITLLCTLVISIILQIIVAKNDLTKYVQNELIIGFYSWMIDLKTDQLLSVINGFALIVGGLSFFLKTWIDYDKENIVFMLLIVVAIAISYICRIYSFQIISFMITLNVGVLMLIPFSYLIYHSLRDSKRRKEKKHTL